jgi:acyl-CoA thioester hydrolase
MTTATLLARFSAVEGALASSFATTQLHHLWGHDRQNGDVVGVVAENGCRYAMPIKFPDPVTVGLCVTRIGNSSVRYEAGVFSGDDADASAESYYIHVYVDRITMRPRALPQALRALLAPIAIGPTD